MWQHAGPIKKIEEPEEGAGVLYYDVDTTGGQSGSPIYLKRSDNDLEMIGIHVGHNKVKIEQEESNDELLNVGTLITPEIW